MRNNLILWLLGAITFIPAYVLEIAPKWLLITIAVVVTIGLILEVTLPGMQRKDLPPQLQHLAEPEETITRQVMADLQHEREQSWKRSTRYADDVLANL